MSDEISPFRSRMNRLSELESLLLSGFSTLREACVRLGCSLRTCGRMVDELRVMGSDVSWTVDTGWRATKRVVPMPDIRIVVDVAASVSLIDDDVI